VTESEQQAALARARQGDRQALSDLLGSLRPFVRVLVRSLRNGRAPGRLDDSDLIQDALLEAHRCFDRFTGDTVAELLAWLRPIILRAARHSLRVHLGTDKRDVAREVGAGAAEQTIDPGSTPSGKVVRAEEAAHLAAGVSRLPEDMQEVLLGRHVDHLSYTTLAEQMGRSEGAVRVLYTRALRRLREEVGD
jgi:RNA polymerase sigma-70 factor (ECF subfamily)